MAGDTVGGSTVACGSDINFRRRQRYRQLFANRQHYWLGHLQRRHQRHESHFPGAEHPGQLRRCDPDHRPVARQPGHRRRQQQFGQRPSTDQRGEPRIVNGTVDIGAFESQGFTFAIVSGNNQSANVSTAFSPLVVSVTANNAGEPVNGGQVTYTVTPVSGAGATLATSPATISSGQASVTPTANATAGTYTVTASASGASSVTFNLTNRADRS